MGCVASCLKILCQSLKNVLMDDLSIIKGVMVVISFCMGPKRPKPTGMPKDACWGFLTVFFNLLSEKNCLRINLMILQISFDFVGGSWMV